MITEELYIGIWACSCDVHVHGTCWRWSWDVNGMPIKLKEALFVNVNGLASNQSINQSAVTRVAHQELSGEPWSMNTHAYPSAPLLFVAGRFGGGIHRILRSPPVAAGWELEIDEGKGGKRLENWEWIIPGSPISPSTTPPQPSPALPSPPRIVAGNYASSRHAISLSMFSPMLATGAGFRHAARSCRTTIHPSLSLSAKFANGGLTEWSGALSSTPACRPGFEPPRGQIFRSHSAVRTPLADH